MMRKINLIALVFGLLAHLYPAVSGAANVKAFKVNGLDMPYAEVGAGPLVVLLHGALSDHRTWALQQEMLAERGYRVVAVTQRYYGLGAWSDDWPTYRIRTHANDLAAFIRAQGSEKAHLVAWSSGVHIALVVALEHPDIVASVFAYEPVVPSYVDDSERLSAIDQDAGEMVGSVFEPLEASDHREAARRFLAGVSQDAGYFDRLTDSARAIALDNARVLPLMFDGGEQDVPVSCDELAAMIPPITVAQGELSRPFFKLIAEGAAKCLAGQSSPFVVPGARHMWPAENAAEFVQAVDDSIRDRE